MSGSVQRPAWGQRYPAIMLISLLADSDLQASAACNPTRMQFVQISPRLAGLLPMS